MPKDKITPQLLQALSRRQFLYGLGATAGSATLFSLPGCGFYRAESCGGAYDAWHFPDSEQRPEYLAVAAAILAASPHNTQPWQFTLTSTRIDLYADPSRGLGAMDPWLREMYIGLGCALENLVIAAQQHGRSALATLLPNPQDESLVASIELAEAQPVSSELYASIAKRHTNRGPYLEEPLPDTLRAALQSQIAEPEVKLSWIDQPEAMQRFRQATIDATRAIAEDEDMYSVSHAWYRHSCDDIDRYRDGVTIDATGLGATKRYLGKSAAAPTAKESGDFWIKATETRQTTAGAFAILSTPDRYNRREQLLCGRAYQRLHLWACSQGLGMQPLNQMAERQDRERQTGIPPTYTQALQTFEPDGGAQMLFRIGYPWDRALQSPRRTVAQVVR